MRLAVAAADVAALGSVLGAATHYLPAVAALLGAIWYALVIYDRLKYGPELEKRMLWQYRTRPKLKLKPPKEDTE